LETFTEAKIKEEQLDGNNLQNNKNTIIQIMQPPNVTTLIPQSQPAKRSGNQQNTFYDMLSQGTKTR